MKSTASAEAPHRVGGSCVPDAIMPVPHPGTPSVWKEASQQKLGNLTLVSSDVSLDRERTLRILVHGINYTPEVAGVGKYSGEMGQWLAKRGHKVRVATAPPYYPEWRVGEDYSPQRHRRYHALNGIKTGHHFGSVCTDLPRVLALMD